LYQIFLKVPEIGFILTIFSAFTETFLSGLAQIKIFSQSKNKK
jgi:hypothetical protein